MLSFDQKKQSVLFTLRKAINHYGLDMQKDVCIEEMSELTKEIIKERRGSNNKIAIVEELCDVTIMISQLLDYYEREMGSEIIDEIIMRKTNRLNKSIDKERLEENHASNRN